MEVGDGAADDVEASGATGCPVATGAEGVFVILVIHHQRHRFQPPHHNSSRNGRHHFLVCGGGIYR